MTAGQGSPPAKVDHCTNRTTWRRSEDGSASSTDTSLRVLPALSQISMATGASVSETIELATSSRMQSIASASASPREARTDPSGSSIRPLSFRITRKYRGKAHLHVSQSANFETVREFHEVPDRLEGIQRFGPNLPTEPRGSVLQQRRHFADDLALAPRAGAGVLPGVSTSNAHGCRSSDTRCCRRSSTLAAFDLGLLQ